MSRGYPQVPCPLEMSFGSGIYSDVVNHLPAAEHRPVRRVDVICRDVITRSRDSLNIMTRLSFSELRNFL